MKENRQNTDECVGSMPLEEIKRLVELKRAEFLKLQSKGHLINMMYKGSRKGSVNGTKKKLLARSF
ncbi:MAG: hypothetical protein WC089_03875 [Candidatus Paceibacterota bacterium]